MFGAFDISTSALAAQRTRLDAIASNIANVNTAVGPDGVTPYHRIFTEFQSQRTEGGGYGVHVSKISEDHDTPMNIVHDPYSKLADAAGNVTYPNVDLSSEMVDALETTRAYEANITAIETTKSMIGATLRVLG